MTAPATADQVVAQRDFFRRDPAGSLAHALLDAAQKPGQVHGAGWRALARAALAHLDGLGVLDRPDADPARISDTVCDAFYAAARARAAELEGVEPDDRDTPTDADREVCRAGLAAALRKIAPLGPFGIQVDERQIDAFWRSAMYATDTDQLATVPRRAIHAGLIGAVNAGLSVTSWHGSSVTMHTAPELVDQPNACGRVDPHDRHLTGTVEHPVQCLGHGGFDS